jgi:hypothetical protein
VAVELEPLPPPPPVFVVVGPGAARARLGHSLPERLCKPVGVRACAGVGSGAICGNNDPTEVQPPLTMTAAATRSSAASRCWSFASYLISISAAGVPKAELKPVRCADP